MNDLYERQNDVEALQSVVKVVESILVCKDKEFQKLVAPHIIAALEEEPSVYDLESYGYILKEEGEELEVLETYWEDMTKKHWEHKDLQETLSYKEIYDSDCQTIKEYLEQTDITRWYYSTNTHSWFWTAENYNIVMYLTKYIDTTLSPKELKDFVHNILFEMNLEEIITEIPTKTLLSAITSKITIYEDDGWGGEMYVKLDNNRINITQPQWEAMTDEIFKRVENNIK